MPKLDNARRDFSIRTIRVGNFNVGVTAPKLMTGGAWTVSSAIESIGIFAIAQNATLTIV